jgi:hypothetical protein
MSAFSPKLAPAPSFESSLYDFSVVGESAPPTYTETSPVIRVKQNRQTNCLYKENKKTYQS